MKNLHSAVCQQENNEPGGVSRNKPADEKDIEQLFEQCLGSEKVPIIFSLNP